MAATPVKLVAVGDGAVGKTSVLMSYSHNKFPEDYTPTVFDNYQCYVRVDDEVVNLNLWDTAGQEDYDRLRNLSYPQTDVFLIVYSVINRDSLQNVLSKWVPEVQHYCPKVPMILCGNKVDLREEWEDKGKDCVRKAEGEAMARKLGAIHVECSAKTQEGLSETYDKAIRSALLGLREKNKPRRKKCTIL